MKSKFVIVGAVVFASGCGDRTPRLDDKADSPEISASSEAVAEVAALQRAFVLFPAAAQALDDRAIDQPRPVLSPPVASGFRLNSGFWVPRFSPANAVSRPADVRLPPTLDQPFEVVDRQSGMTIGVQVLGMTGSPARVADGHLLYGTQAEEHRVVHRPHPEGTEDFVVIRSRPAREEIAYEVELRAGVAGLRWVGNVLEFLDRSGDPRLRVKAPGVADGSGRLLSAKLTLDGCAADHSPALPWGRPTTAPGANRCRIRVGWNAPHYPVMVDPGFETTGSMAVARQSHTATLLSGDTVLVVGGTWPSIGVQGSAEAWHGGSFSFAGSMVTPRRWHAAASLTSDRVLVVGGNAGSSAPIATAEVWSAGTFSSAGSLLTAREWHTATPLSGDRVLIAGGVNSGSTMLKSAEVWEAGAFSSTGSMSVARYYHTATPLSEDRVLVVGGLGNNTAEVWNAGAFTSAGTMATARENHTASLLPGDLVLVVGGYGKASAELWNAGVFSNAGTMSSPRWNHTATTLPDGRVLVIGGLYASAMKSSEAWKANAFASAGELGVARMNQSATPLLDGHVLVVGGGNDSSAYKSAELWNPSTPGVNGLTCAVGSDCVSGFCVSGMCCDTACAAPNFSCRADATAAPDGTCSVINVAGHCPTAFVDGVCCDVPCVGLCRACTKAKRGQPDGTCALVPTGADPDNECDAPGAGVCKLPGVCDGAGACKNNAGTVCGTAAHCNGDTLINAPLCDAVGNCGQATTTSCGNYHCANGACATTCASSADCVNSQCVNGKCGTGIKNGNLCSSDDSCESLHCVAGICCNTACAAACMSCFAVDKASGSDGECGFVLDGKDPFNQCSDSGTECGPDGQCNGQGLCRGDAPDTKSCGATTCAGGSVSGKVCSAGECSDEPGKSCGAYKCNPQGSACMSSCSVTADCSGGNFCKAGVCTAVLDNGQDCTLDEQCTSSFCVDGYCCDNRCDGQCSSCSGDLNASGFKGQCGLVKAGTLDPRGTCKKDSSNVCGTDGRCDDLGQCALAEKDSQCKGAQCEVDNAVTWACDGFGNCQSTSLPCSPFKCDSVARACKSTCATDTDCTSGSVCDTQKHVCAQAASTCRDATTERLPNGTEHSCVPYTCDGNTCRTSCDTSANCASGYACKNKSCVESTDPGDSGAVDAGAPVGAAAGDDGDGCGCRVSSRAEGRQHVLVLLSALGLLLRRRGRSRRSA